MSLQEYYENIKFLISKEIYLPKVLSRLVSEYSINNISIKTYNTRTRLDLEKFINPKIIDIIMSYAQLYTKFSPLDGYISVCGDYLKNNCFSKTCKHTHLSSKKDIQNICSDYFRYECNREYDCSRVHLYYLPSYDLTKIAT